jgi:hypothetical protein
MVLTAPEDDVLQAYLAKPPVRALDDRGLKNRCSAGDPPKVLRNLKEKYHDSLGQAIRLPLDGKASGGYQVTIRRAKF